jgi:hypothetical protein
MQNELPGINPKKEAAPRNCTIRVPTKTARTELIQRIKGRVPAVSYKNSENPGRPGDALLKGMLLPADIHILKRRAF